MIDDTPIRKGIFSILRFSLSFARAVFESTTPVLLVFATEFADLLIDCGMNLQALMRRSMHKTLVLKKIERFILEPDSVGR